MIARTGTDWLRELRELRASAGDTPHDRAAVRYAEQRAEHQRRQEQLARKRALRARRPAGQHHGQGRS
jgi:hypothetical protein